MVRNWAILALFVTACSGAPAKQDSVSDPPKDADVKPMPDGPDVVADAIQPRSTRDVEQIEASNAPGVVQKLDVEAFLRRGPAYVLTQVEVSPVHGNAGFEGFQIASVTPNVESFIVPQLRVGDVITHLNGVKIERPDDYLQAWNRAKDVDVLSVDFMREGQKMTAQWRVE